MYNKYTYNPYYFIPCVFKLSKAVFFIVNLLTVVNSSMYFIKSDKTCLILPTNSFPTNCILENVTSKLNNLMPTVFLSDLFCKV